MEMQSNMVELREDSIFVHRNGMRMRCWRHPGENCSILCPMLGWDEDHVWFLCREHGDAVIVYRKHNEEEPDQ